MESIATDSIYIYSLEKGLVKKIPDHNNFLKCNFVEYFKEELNDILRYFRENQPPDKIERELKKQIKETSFYMPYDVESSCINIKEAKTYVEDLKFYGLEFQTFNFSKQICELF